MGKRGPKTKPIAIHVAEGTYRNSRHGGAVVAAPGTPSKPDWLDEIGSAYWDSAIANLQKTPGLLAAVDEYSLSVWCDAWEDYHAARKTIEEEGRVCIGEKGGEYPHPAVGMKNHARAIIAKLGKDFGMDPSARSDLKLTAPTHAGVRRRQAT